MSFSYIRVRCGCKEYISSDCSSWTEKKEGASDPWNVVGKWSTAKEAITALATRFSRSRNKSNSNWKKEDILKWMIDENTELEFTGASE